MIASGLIAYGAAWPLAGLPPAWLIALWMVFGTCIEATARMLGAHQLALGAVLGALLAPPTYWAGSNFSALEFAEPQWMPLLVTGLVWAIATPLMLLAFRRASGRN